MYGVKNVSLQLPSPIAVRLISKIEINAMITSLADLHQINPHPMVLLLEIPAPSHLPSPTLLVMSKWSYDCELAFFVVLAVKAKKCAFCKFRNFKLSNERAPMKNRTLVKTEKTIPSSITIHHSPFTIHTVGNILYRMYRYHTSSTA